MFATLKVDLYGRIAWCVCGILLALQAPASTLHERKVFSLTAGSCVEVDGLVVVFFGGVI